MSKASVVVSFVVCIIFNIFLNSFDVYSDTALAYNALTFNLGDSLLLSGCRACHGKDNIDVFNCRNSFCKQCLTKNHMFTCGRSFEMLDRLLELQNKHSCENEPFAFNFNASSKAYDFRNGVCNTTTDRCCVDNTGKPNLSTSLDSLDKRIIAYHTQESGFSRSKLRYDSYVLSAKLSNFHCQKEIKDYFNRSNAVFNNFINNNVTVLEYRNKSETSFKLVKSKNNKVSLENGFSYEDECGLLVTNKMNNYIQNNGENTCGCDPCLVHLQKLMYHLNISDLNDWKQNTFYGGGVKYGGQVCDLLWRFGLATLVPITLNMMFNLSVFLEDLHEGNAFKVEMIFVFILFYPQWRTLRFLGQYLYNRDEAQLNKSKDKFDVQVGSLEPFLESAFQVRKTHSFVA